MTVLVPFDGSDLPKAALLRAAQFDGLLNQGVIAVTVIPRGDAKYARERDWIDGTDPLATDSIVSTLRSMVADVDPDTEFR
ncbi:universal stress protein [Halobellus ruber]|uniref:Universal stress protein n=1 Tax=Halobellus ruber TaxID=2761102 RepID=A0A7J9SF34_9EURY|nr:universal stress protein [Halobellus ruber]MBB6645575.1 universal stress protein [Halobellus ruber]